MKHRIFTVVSLIAMFGHSVCAAGGAGHSKKPATLRIPTAIRAIMNRSKYSKATWGIRVVDLGSGKLIYDLKPDFKFHIASVRKLFSVGLALNQLGPGYKFSTPVYRNGEVTGGVLNGDLVLVASGDITMGGRDTAEGTIAFTNFDHTEANSLGSAILTAPDPLGGLDRLARQVAASGITTVRGDIVIDDRLFVPFNFRGEFDVQPIVINDDMVDVSILPTIPGNPANLDWRPQTGAFQVRPQVLTVAKHGKTDVTLSSKNPGIGNVDGTIAVGFVPPLPDVDTLVQTFLVKDPAGFARTAFIEALRRAGVTVGASPTGPNPVSKLPPSGSYTPATRVADLVSLPYSQDAKLILKVSHNLGADLSLMLYGLAKGVNNQPAALAAERKILAESFGINGSQFTFVDGSGGGETVGTTAAVLKFIQVMSGKPTFPAFFDALPKLAEDGSLAVIKKFEADPTLKGAQGRVHAKTGTYLLGVNHRLMLKGQAFAGYIDARSGRRLMYGVFVDNVPVNSIADIIDVFNDEGTISANIWKNN